MSKKVYYIASNLKRKGMDIQIINKPYLNKNKCNLELKKKQIEDINRLFYITEFWESDKEEMTRELFKFGIAE